MAEHCLPPPPAPVAAPIVENPAVEPLPVVEEPPAVETQEEVIFPTILLVLSQVHLYFPSSFFYFGFISVNLYTPFCLFGAIAFMHCIVLRLLFPRVLHASVALCCVGAMLV